MDGGDQAEAFGGLGVVRQAGQQHGLGPRHPDQAGQPVGRGHQADIDPGADEPGLGRGDADVAAQGQLEAAADAPAVDRRDYRRAGGVQPLQQTAEAGQVLRLGPGVLQVIAAAKGPATAGDDDGAQGVIGLDFVQRPHESRAHGAPSGFIGGLSISSRTTWSPIRSMWMVPLMRFSSSWVGDEFRAAISIFDLGVGEAGLGQDFAVVLADLGHAAGQRNRRF